MVSPTEVVVVVLFAVALILVPSALAFAIMSLAKLDRRAPEAPRPVAAYPRGSSPRRATPQPRHNSPRRFDGR